MRVYRIERRARVGGKPCGAVHRWPLHFAGEGRSGGNEGRNCDQGGGSRRLRMDGGGGYSALRLRRWKYVRCSAEADARSDSGGGEAKDVRAHRLAGGKAAVGHDAEEIATMRAAAALGCRLFEGMLATMQPGMAETAVAAELEHAARMAGAEAMSFPTIVASGERSSLPHGNATAAKLPRRGFVTLDFGVVLDGYCSDMTRTIHMGPARAGERNAYDAVLEAQEAGVAAVRAGVSGGDVDEAARGVLRKAGLADWFTHSTGHGVGLEIHEGPRLAAKQTQILEAGMVITIEPGIYRPGKFGVRIEDMVLVTARGGEILTPATKAWIEL